jgi:dihydrofolate reductase
MKPRLSLIVAAARNSVIGVNNTLPWHLPADLRHFKALTMGHHIIMGRKTYESIGKPLPGRTSVIVTRNAGYSATGATVVNSLEQGIEACQDDTEVFVIGGEELYRQTIPLADRIYLTEIDTDMPGDAYFPELNPASWREIRRDSHPPDDKNQYRYHFVIFDRKAE